MLLVVKNPPAVQETQEMQVQSLSLEDPLEEGMPTILESLPGESQEQRSLVPLCQSGQASFLCLQATTFTPQVVYYCPPVT